MSKRARRAAPLTLRDLDGTPLAASVGGLLLQRAGHATALVSLAGLRDPAAVAAAAQRHGALLLDLKQASESLVVEYRQRVLWALALAALLLAATVWLALRSPRRVLRVLLPMALSTLLVVAVLRACGVELTLFHLVALILAAGLGLDYALFFEHAGDDRAGAAAHPARGDRLQPDDAAGVRLLALSSIPVLRAIGSTVALGVRLQLRARPADRAPPRTRGRACDRDDAIAALIPHAGAMCLRDEIIAWDERAIVLRAHDHRDPAHPLRSDGRLRALHLCEYGAQAMAVHGGLLARRAGGRAPPGMLVALRGVELYVARIDDLAGAARMRSRAWSHAATPASSMRFASATPACCSPRGGPQ